MKHTPRWNKLIKPRLQMRLVLVFAGISVTSLLMQFLLMQSCMVDLASRMPTGGEYVFDTLPDMLQSVLITSLCVILPLILGVGVLVTFRVAGPVYRFEQYMKHVAAGESVGPCRIRKGDELQELCDAINSAMASMRSSDGAHGDSATGTTEEPVALKRSA